MSRLLIVGAGGHGRVAADCAELLGWEEIAFLDDGQADTNCPWPIVGPANRQSLAEHAAESAHFFVALGDNSARARALEILSDLGLGAETLIHPTAHASGHAEVAGGCLMAMGSSVGPMARLDAGVIVNTGASVDHDCALGPCVHVSPGARLAGGVTVGQRSWIGIGASIREGIQIGADALVGAGAAVVADVPDGARVAGVPAKAMDARP